MVVTYGITCGFKIFHTVYAIIRVLLLCSKILYVIDSVYLSFELLLRQGRNYVDA